MTLMLDNACIATILDAGDVIAVLDSQYRAHSRGATVSPPRIDLQRRAVADSPVYQLGIAAGLSERYAAIRLKSDMVSERILDGRRRKEKFCLRPGLFMGLILLFDLENGDLLAIMHDGLIQKMRVGADSALGVQWLARPDAANLGLLGAGGMARSHVAAISRVRKLKRIRIYSPTRANRETLAAEIRAEYGIDAQAVDIAAQVYAGADIVSACTSAIGPVVEGALLEDGTHVTAIGGSLDAAANRRLSVALRLGEASNPVEYPDLNYNGEALNFAVGGEKAGAGSTRHFADPPQAARRSLADLLVDPTRGRTDPAQITFSERGNIHGLQFAAVAGGVYERAQAAGLGQELPDGIFLEDIRN